MKLTVDWQRMRMVKFSLAGFGSLNGYYSLPAGTHGLKFHKANETCFIGDMLDAIFST